MGLGHFLLPQHRAGAAVVGEVEGPGGHGVHLPPGAPPSTLAFVAMPLPTVSFAEIGASAWVGEQAGQARLCARGR